MWRSLLQTWLLNRAKGTARDAVWQAAQQQLHQAAAAPAIADESQPCHIGVVFALGIESGCFEDRLTGGVSLQGQQIQARVGELQGQRVVVVLAGAGRARAARATELLLDGHHPQCVISAGFAGGLSAQLKRNAILLAESVALAEGDAMPLELPPALRALAQQPGVHTGPLLTVDHVVRLPREKRALHEKHGAAAVDMETFAVAQVCRQRQTPFLAVRVINDTVHETLPHDIEHLLVQKTGPARLGAALGAVWRRPESIKDMYRLRENALVASDRLAKFLADLIGPPSA